MHKPTEQEKTKIALKQAKSLLKKGDYRSAASIYQQLALTSGSPQREQYQMLAADALLNSDDNVTANAIADSINPMMLPLKDRYKLYLFYGQVELNAGNPGAALNQLDLIPYEQLEPRDRLRYHQQRAAVYSLTGNLPESVRERILIGELLDSRTLIDNNNTAILEALALMPNKTLEQLRTAHAHTLDGWIDLSHQLIHYQFDVNSLKRKVVDWRRKYPTHPADQEFLRIFLEKWAEDFRPPASIAVLLPQSGPYAGAANAIRDGFISAYYTQDVARRPRIHFYDSQSLDVYTIYQTAIANGADFIVGPLAKNKIESLAMGDLQVPVLALNQLPDLYRENMFQYGLNPEDEAKQAASLAWFDGHHAGLILTPASSFGQRIASHFAAYWRQLGGEILEVQTYNRKENDFSMPIKQLLNLDESEQRYQQIKKIDRDLKFQPRRRRDVDFIFLVSRSHEARLIRPQIQFHRASHVPIYTTSHVYTGHQNVNQDIDLDDIIFCDIPWLFDVDSNGQRSRQDLEDIWHPKLDNYVRLVALGIDAYDVIPHLYRLKSGSNARYSGTTGTLSVDDENRVHRQLHCAEFKKGAPNVLGLAPYLQLPESVENRLPIEEGIPINAQ